MADTQVDVLIIDGAGTQRDALWVQDPSGTVAPQMAPRTNGQPVGSTNGLPTVRQTFIPVAVTGSLTAGSSGVAQSLQQAVSTPGITVVICNPASALGQGLGAVESVWVDAVTTAQATGGSTSIEIPPGITMVIGPTTNAISWIATTGGHRIGAYAYI